jgi:putative transposase
VLHQAVPVRIYPTKKQQTQLAQTFGCARWWWNYAMNKSIEAYQETGKGLGPSALNALLPDLKKAEETAWLADCYSQILQATTLNLTTAYKNFLDKRAGLPKFKSKHGKQSIQYPQNVKIVDGNVKLPGHIGIVKAKIHRLIEGKIKTVTISKTPSGKYLASILTEVEGEHPTTTEGKISGIDIELKHFAVVTLGKKVSKYDNQ